MTKEGRLVYGSNTVRLRLANTPNPYRPVRRIPGFSGGITGTEEGAQSGDLFIRRWSMSDWEQGELGGKWKPGGYRESSNVRPDKIGDKLVLGAFRQTIQDDAGTPADFGDSFKFIRAHGGLYTTGTTDDEAHLWSLANENFPLTGWTTGATTQVPTTGADFGDGTDLLIGYNDKSIRRVASGHQSEHFAASGASFNPELRSFQGTVYYLDGPDLYSLNTGTTEIGAATFDFTGGGVEDEWTFTAHGLSTGDAVTFSAVGAAPTEYAVDTTYYVVAVPDANTFQLSATVGGSVIEGTADSTGTWTLESYNTDTRTVLSDPGDRVNVYMASSGNIYRRLCVTDTGVAWINPDDDGRTTIYEYNAKIQTDFASGKLPVEGAFPYSTLFGHGFIFVAYRYASAHGEQGPAHVYWQRGGQNGTTNEIRLSEASTASQPVILAGFIGDDLIFYYSKALYAYDLSAGAVYQIAAAGATSTAVSDAITFGKDVFIANTDNSEEAERFVTTLYSTDAATWKSGRFDFDYPAVKKALYRVTVVHDPLPANTQLTLKVAADGGTFTTVTGTDSTDNATSFTWTASSSSSQVTGHDFELELTFASTTSASTPTVREVFAEAGPAEKRRGFEVDLDVAGTGTVGSGASTQLLSQLLDAVEYTGGVVKFTDPWGVADNAAATDREVMVEVAGGGQEAGVVTVRLWELDTV